MGITVGNKGSYDKDYTVDTPDDVKKSKRDEPQETEYFAEQSAAETQDPVNPAFGDPEEVAEAKAERDEELERDREENYDPYQDLNPPAGIPEEVEERRQKALAEEREEAAERGHTGTVDTADVNNPESVAAHAPVFDGHEAPPPAEGDANPAYGDPEVVAEAKQEQDAELAKQAGNRETGGVDPMSDENPDGKARSEEDGEFDPNEHTVQEIKDYIEEHPEDRTRVLEAEADGQDRKGLQAEAELFDPAAHSVPEVKKHIEEHPEDKERVLDLEAKGQDRKGLQNL